mgnify:FL=1
MVKFQYKIQKKTEKRYFSDILGVSEEADTAKTRYGGEKMTEQKLKELLADMTLEEKVNQMSQVVGAFFNKDMDITAMGPMADKGFTPENVALSGSILGSMGAETLKKIQKDFVEQHPHHIPMLFMLDVINGFKTNFPDSAGTGRNV